MSVRRTETRDRRQEVDGGNAEGKMLRNMNEWMADCLLKGMQEIEVGNDEESGEKSGRNN